MEKDTSVINMFFTRHEFCELASITNQLLQHHIEKNNVDYFLKDGKAYLCNNEKNRVFIAFYKSKND